MRLKLRRKASSRQQPAVEDCCGHPTPAWVPRGAGGHLRNAITSAVSPRLAGRVRHALPLASAILLVTLGAVVGLVFALRSQTVENCASAPLAVLTGLDDPTCRNFVSSNYGVKSNAGSTNFQAELVWQQIPPALSSWIGAVSLSASAIFGSFTKCSFFPDPCHLVELAFSLYGIVDLGNRLRQQPGSPSRPAPLPGVFTTATPRGGIAAAWSSGSILPDALRYLGANARPVTDSAALVLHALALPPPPSPLPPSNTNPWFLNTTIIKLLPAPANAPCCDVRLERNAAAPGRYAIRLTSSNVPDFPPTTSGSCPDRDLRCSTISISIATDFSCWAPDSPSTQDYTGSPCSGSGRDRLDFTADFSVYIGAWETLNELGVRTTDAGTPAKTFIYRTDKASFDASQHAPANGSSAAAWAAYGLDIPAIYEEHGADMAAWAALLAFACGYGVATASFLVSGSLTVEQGAEAPAQIRLEYYGWANGWWEQLNIYCCESIRPTYLSAIGNALGYAGPVEVGVAFVCVCVYMVLYPEERKWFGMLFGGEEGSATLSRSGGGRAGSSGSTQRRRSAAASQRSSRRLIKAAGAAGADPAPRAGGDVEATAPMMEAALSADSGGPAAAQHVSVTLV